MSEWISVEDRMPEPEVEVMVFLNDMRRVAMLLWEQNDWESGGGSYLYWADPGDYNDPYEHDEVTHWQPLPPPPGAPE